MYCDRSAYYQKAIKATARRLKTNTNLLWLFLLFGRLVFFAYARQSLAFSLNEAGRFAQHPAPTTLRRTGDHRSHQPCCQLCSFSDYSISPRTGYITHHFIFSLLTNLNLLPSRRKYQYEKFPKGS